MPVVSWLPVWALNVRIQCCISPLLVSTGWQHLELLSEDVCTLLECDIAEVLAKQIPADGDDAAGPVVGTMGGQVTTSIAREPRASAPALGLTVEQALEEIFMPPMR